MSATATNRLPEGIDLANPDSYVDALPLDWFRRLREEAPVVWHPEPAPNHGFWAVTRYDDLTAVHMDWATYSSEVGAVALEELDAEQLEIRRSMLETDPPRHTALRKICSKRFSARGVGAFEDWIREVASEVLDRALVSDEPFDFVAQISRELPIRFLCSIFTVPQDDAPQLISLGRQDDRQPGPRALRGGRGRVDTEAYRLLPFRSPTALDVFAYADRQRDDRLVEPSDDVIQALVTAQSEGMLDEREYHNYFSLLMIAGNETTRHTISSGMLALIEQPRADAAADGGAGSHRGRRRGDPAMGDAGAALPADGHARHGARVVRRSAQGDKVVTWYISANHDMEMFADPDRFDVTRTPNDHVTFGPGGPHFCLGAHLARLETKILFQELLPRLASIEIVGRRRAHPVELRQRHQADAGAHHDPLRLASLASTELASARSIDASFRCSSGSSTAATRASSSLKRGKRCSIVCRPDVRQRDQHPTLVVGIGATNRPAARLERRITPVAVGRLMPTAAAKSRASISPHTQSTHSPRTTSTRAGRARARSPPCAGGPPRRAPEEVGERRHGAEVEREVAELLHDPAFRGQASSAHAAAPCREPLAQVPRDVDQRQDVVLGRAEVHEARAEPDVAVDQRRRQVDAAVGLDRLGQGALCAFSSSRLPARGGSGTIDSCGGASMDLEVLRRLGVAVEEVGLFEVALDRLAELRRAVRAEGQPQLQRAERPRVLQRDVDGVQLVSLVRQVALLVREGRGERLVVVHHHDPARLGQVQPLVRVHRARNPHARAPRTARGRCWRPPAGRRRRPHAARRRAPRRPSAIASSGSTAPVSVVPAVATTAIGVAPAARSSSIIAARAPGRIRRSPSRATARRWSEPMPSSSTARVTE